MNTVSIRWRMTFWISGAFAAVLVGFSLLLHQMLERTHYDQVDRALRDRLSQLADQAKHFEDLQTFLQSWQSDSSHQFLLVVLDHKGAVVAHAADIPGADLPKPPETLTAPQLDDVAVAGFGDMRRMTERVEIGRKMFTVSLLAELEHLQEEMALVAWALWITVPLALAVAAVLAYLLAKKAFEPVESLRKSADQITVDRLEQRLPIPNRKDELGRLTETINAMIARLQRSFDEVRRFTADASHELRTPIAIIHSEAEMALEAASLEDAQFRCGSILEECERLGAMTDQLLLLSRADAGVGRTQQMPVELSKITSAVVDIVRPLAEAKNIDLKLGPNEKTTVIGDAVRLRQVLLNLLDNAIKYTAEGGQVDVKLSSTGTEALVDVDDTGIGISKEHLPHVFERFYRASVMPCDESRPAGAGLGLSIVKSILAAHGGDVEIASPNEHGCHVRVRLPRTGNG